MTLPPLASTMLTLPSNDDSVTHLSFDNISRSRDYDALMKVNSSSDIHQHYQEPTHHRFKRDVHQLNTDDSPSLVDNLKSEQPISTPMTLADPSQPSLLSLNHDRFLINHTNDHDDGQFPSFSLSTDDTIRTSGSTRRDRCSSMLDDQLIEHSPSVVLNQNRISQRIPTTSPASLSMSSESGDRNSVSYGVDWSDRARPTSHCWFPYTFNYPSTAQRCAYATCSNRKPTVLMPFLQCGSCGLTVHAHHLNDSHATEDNVLSSCRPSFIDNPISEKLYVNGEDNPSNFDKHFWTHIPTLTEPCVYCNRKSIPKGLFVARFGQTSTRPALHITCQDTTITSTLSKSCSPKMSHTSTGLLCLWCFRSYHQQCWEHLNAEEDKIKCDYGLLRNIIVRPQWLHRSNQSSSGFRAGLSSHSTDSCSTLNSFPYTPTLVFINKRSGGQNGEEIYRKLLQKLNPRQVFLLESDATIVNALDIYISLPNTRICVCGGDGSVSWFLSRIAEVYSSNNNPPVAICPLGTCNDLSRVLAWGGHYNSKQLLPTLLKIPQAQVVPLDRWQVHIEHIDLPNLTSMRRQHRD
ncbi:unnamed protein product, partial [Rotaria sordida]